MSLRRGLRRPLVALAFAAAAGCFAMGLAGRSGFWLAAIASLALLTIGFFLASPGSGGD